MTKSIYSNIVENGSRLALNEEQIELIVNKISKELAGEAIEDAFNFDIEHSETTNGVIVAVERTSNWPHFFEVTF